MDEIYENGGMGELYKLLDKSLKREKKNLKDFLQFNPHSFNRQSLLEPLELKIKF